MKANDWLKQATQQLSDADISTGRLDVLVLLEDSIQKDKSYLLAHPEIPLTAKQVVVLDAQIERRKNHEPLAYIRGKAEFYGREFLVTPDTLQPRPETETMVELALKAIGDRLEVIDKPLGIIDIGTGSGALAITMKLEIPHLQVSASDISDDCIKIAHANADKLDAEVTLYVGDLLEPFYNLQPVTYNLFAILANLPYVPDAHTINQAAMQEPKVAIFGGPDGLDIYRRLFGQIKELALKPAYILTESLPFQHAELAKVAGGAGYMLQQTDDFIQLFKQGSR